jgi:2-oxoglutarate dehydrogenase E1 component
VSLQQDFDRISFDSSNSDLLEELFTEWQKDPKTVSPDWDRYFSKLQAETASPAGNVPSDGVHYKQGRVNSLMWAYRDVGYLYARLNPLEGYMPRDLMYVFKTIQGNYESLSLKEFGLGENDLETEFSAGRYLDPPKDRLKGIITSLQETYCSYIGYEILHIQNKPVRNWLIRRIEQERNVSPINDAQKRIIQNDLVQAEEFEHFLHSRFVGQKRFSLEGSEALIPALHYLVDIAAGQGLEEIVIGMSHRGRLNVLANVMGKPAVQTFNEFEDKDDSPTFSGSGDVKYHLGYSTDHQNDDGTSVHISLVANPSHLEAVDAVVLGKTRGIQRRRGDRVRRKVIPVILHGDAAFSGQGIVAETFNLSKLRGYDVGGAIHIVVNNQIGFTTAGKDSRSSYFPTDMAKAMPFPIFHVNGDHPEEVIKALDLGIRFRQKFGYDVIIDIFCYRRYGHNEADDPSFTHPIMYKMIKKTPGVRTLYGRDLDGKGIYTEQDQSVFSSTYVDGLKQALETARSDSGTSEADGFKSGEWDGFIREYSHTPVETGVELETLKAIGDTLTTVPGGFEIHSKLSRIIADRRKMYQEGEALNWSAVELLTFGTLLIEGTHIRLSGEDSSRGTFSQRHAIWWNVNTDDPQPYSPLNLLVEDQAKFTVYDSPLSEYSILGFEFGNSLAQPRVLSMWEAQFGDFSNGAQVIIDQFVAASEAKWDRSTGLVLLLPHGYEGQGPEHSNAFLERYLQLCAQDNMQVCNLTTPAQYFHLLRRQMKREFRKPLILMTPKSLLRHKKAVSNLTDLSRGHFREVLPDNEKREDARHLLLCSGKVYYDLLDKREELGDRETAIIRMEQFYPYPQMQLEAAVQRYKKAESLTWVQEEPKNRGAWSFLYERLQEGLKRPVRYVGRAASASPAEGSYRQHIHEQNRLLDEAFFIQE